MTVPRDPGRPVGRRIRLLPPGGPHGWTPYAWLVYLPTLTLDPYFFGRPAWQAAWTYAGTAAFLAAYFRAYWVRGREQLLLIVFIAALGAALAPINGGSSVLFVYACGFAGQRPTARAALRTTALVTLAGLATAYVVGLPYWYYLVVGVFGPLIGGVNLHFARLGRASRALLLAQDEVRHLAAVAERERIARDLHDVLGHTLSLITLKSELAAKLVERDPARAAREMREVEQVSRAALHEVRETIRGYHATLADELSRARALLATAHVAADVSSDGAAGEAAAAHPRALDEALALALREAVTNVVRHAGASRCRVRVTADGDAVRLEVWDDGHGSSAPEGAGLRGMRDRIEALGGSVRRATGPAGAGTTLVVTLPRAAPGHETASLSSSSPARVVAAT